MFLPSNKSIRRHVVNSLEPYWINAASRIEALPVRRIEREPVFHLPLRLVSVTLPEWATNCGVQECLMIPNEALLDINSRDWRDVDWWLAAFLLLEAWHERLWECRHGPIHSYSVCLKDWDERVWQHAWVNRIGLFLRQWSIHLAGITNVPQLGPLPLQSFI